MGKFGWLLMFFTINFHTQILEKYPDGQEDYYGGNLRFYQDFHQILIDQKMKPCENKQEFYTIKLVVYPDKTVKYVRPEDSVAVARNKCTFDLTKSVLKYMDRWKPATVDGKEVPALTSFLIYPDDLFEKYQPGYTPDKFFKKAEFPGGISAFREKVFRVSDISGFKFTGDVKVAVGFTIDVDGSMKDVKILQSSGLKQFDDRMIENIKYIKIKWTPASFHDIPLRNRFRLPINIAGDRF